MDISNHKSLILKSSIENIYMPDDVKTRIIDKCTQVNMSTAITGNVRKPRRFVMASLCACAAIAIIVIGIMMLTGNTITHTVDNNVLNINVVNSVSYANADIGIYAEDFVAMTYEDIMDYYGKEIVPTVPTDLKATLNDNYGIYKRDGGTGEIYYDNTVCEYTNEDGSRSVRLEVAKDKLPAVCTIIETFNPKVSYLNGTELIIHSLSNDDGTHYYTRFISNGIGYDMEISNLTVEEIYDLLNSLTK